MSITDRQADYIAALASQRGMDIDTSSMTKAEASETIDRLLLTVPVPDADISVTYAPRKDDVMVTYTLRRVDMQALADHTVSVVAEADAQARRRIESIVKGIAGGLGRIRERVERGTWAELYRAAYEIKKIQEVVDGSGCRQPETVEEPETVETTDDAAPRGTEDTLVELQGDYRAHRDRIQAAAGRGYTGPMPTVGTMRAWHATVIRMARRAGETLTRAEWRERMWTYISQWVAAVQTVMRSADVQVIETGRRILIYMGWGWLEHRRVGREWV